MTLHAVDGSDINSRKSMTTGKPTQLSRIKDCAPSLADISALSLKDILRATPGENPDR